MDLFAVVTLFCLEQGNRSLEEHKFLGLTHRTTFPDDCLSTFLHAGLNSITRAQLSGEGPRGSFVDYVEWVLVSCGSSLAFKPANNDTSSTPDPEPSQTPPSCILEHQSEPTADRASNRQTIAKRSDRPKDRPGARASFDVSPGV
ncbi:Gag-Pol polyprotein [Labeo rohita]|uniref:Gag-Pol polyprotein n=1 Tax=Labeo rohita TaxID=84645 RepID=A0ABQ8LKC3_LABRO|nr:Gag-Pol polyprotein [Labeo rohita]